MYTLLVIDMQAGFLNRFDDEDEKQEVIDNCRRVVMKAIADGAEIIDVNYIGSYGPTIPEIRNLWRGYKKMFKHNVKKVMKPYDGGGDQVMEADPQYDEFLACGINAGACVRSTVFELRDGHGVDVYVIAEAVANCWGGKDSDLDHFENNAMLTNMA
jgi:nicotinamidase-related amidase